MKADVQIYTTSEQKATPQGRSEEPPSPPQSDPSLEVSETEGKDAGTNMSKIGLARPVDMANTKQADQAEALPKGNRKWYCPVAF